MKKAVRDIQNISLPKGMYRAVGVCALRKFGFSISNPAKATSQSQGYSNHAIRPVVFRILKL